jgi:hypothetical protein
MAMKCSEPFRVCDRIAVAIRREKAAKGGACPTRIQQPANASAEYYQEAVEAAA